MKVTEKGNKIEERQFFLRSLNFFSIKDNWNSGLSPTCGARGKTTTEDNNAYSKGPPTSNVLPKTLATSYYC